MGTNEFATPSLERLLAEGFNIVGVVTQPDRPSGRGQRLTPPPVKVAALRRNLPVYQPEKVRHREVVRQLRALQPEAIVVVSFGQILPKSVLELPPWGCLNVHPSLLPRYRGAAPIQWALMNGETETGITIMLMDEGEDTGDIILQERVPIADDDNAITLTDRLANLAPALLIKALAAASDGPPPHEPQNHAEATHAPRLTQETGKIDWAQPAHRIRNLVRGALIWPGACTFFNGRRLKITACAVAAPPRFTDAPGGMIYITPDKELVVICGEGALRLDRVQPETKREMDGKAFINGYRLQTGDRFTDEVSS
jgi:methionyl-tRNA formyltransferase